MSPAAGEVSSRRDWSRFLAGFLAIYAVLQLTAAGLGSQRGEAGLVVGALVTIVTLAVERAWTGRLIVAAAHAVGLGLSRGSALALAAGR